MNELIFASGNLHKLTELRNKSTAWRIHSMREAGFEGEIDETGTTLEENAKIKADFIHQRFGQNCFADDSGIEIEALNGRPGVYSARYAGEGCTFNDNNEKVLNELKGVENRNACFRTVIHLILDGAPHVFEGEVKGQITYEIAGKLGFGYDPIFKPLGFDKTFAEMTLEEKNKISHRAKALDQLFDFLNRTGR